MDELVQRFEDFARAFRSGAPLYSRLAQRCAVEPEVLRLMNAAPAMQRIPVLLFACVHYLLLQDPSHNLARHYPNLANQLAAHDNGDDFVDFVLQHHSQISALLKDRSTQTNEIGRCNWFLFPFAILDREVGALAHIDIGSSAGLNLLFPHVAFDMPPRALLGDSTAFTILCQVNGPAPTVERLPRITWSLGLDAAPINVHEDEQVRWLEACVWPDNVDRFRRLRSAIALARQHNVRVEQGDAVIDIAQLIERATPWGHPVITTSWVLNYLSPDQRRQFVAGLDRIGAQQNISWVIGESPRETPELPVNGQLSEEITVISLVTWRDGQRQSRRLATTHPHGNWITWET